MKAEQRFSSSQFFLQVIAQLLSGIQDSEVCPRSLPYFFYSFPSFSLVMVRVLAVGLF